MENKERNIDQANKIYAAEEKLFEACPKMKDPSWWDQGSDGEPKIPEQTNRLIEENAAKAKEMR